MAHSKETIKCVNCGKIKNVSYKKYWIPWDFGWFCSVRCVNDHIHKQVLP